MASSVGTDDTTLFTRLDSTLKQQRRRLEAMNEQLAQYKRKNQMLVEKEKEMDRLDQEKHQEEQLQKEDTD
ncbi:unnamed protein product [Absidia cylindrospora]